MLPALVILVIGVVVVVGMVIVLRVNAFIALITAAMLVSLLSKGPWEEKITRVATAFGSVVGNIGIVIALAAVIGKCLMDSGAADRIVRSFLRALGEKRAATALMGSGFVLAVPVFFDTVFYLLVPLARSLWKRTRRHYMLYVTAIAAGGAITHTLVPPTPGPLYMASELNINLGKMILVGCLIGLPSALVGLVACKIIDRLMDIPMRPYAGEPEREPLDDDQLPPLWLSLLPVVLPVLLISANTVAGATASPAIVRIVTAILGNPNLALLISAAIAMFLLVHYRNATLKDLAAATDVALMSGGIIILITAGGGAFGAMLKLTGIQENIESVVGNGSQAAGVIILLSAAVVASALKFAQGSGTVAMITTTSIFAGMSISPEMLGCDLVYLATAIGSGSLIGTWMNDSGFWIFARMGGLTEVETLKSWTVLLAILGLASLAITLVLSRLFPMVNGLG